MFKFSKPSNGIRLLYGLLAVILFQFMSVGLCDDLPENKALEQKIWKEPNTEITFIRMVGDCFRMGSPYRADALYFHERPRHNVCLSSYYIGVTEVTNAQYHKFNPNHKRVHINNTPLDAAEFPVVNVSLAEVKEFAKWLTQKHQGTYRFRLPTEAEWEHACREGIKTERYWDREANDSCLYANLMDHSPSKKIGQVFSSGCMDNHKLLAPVGSYLPNKFGLFDMLGNVWEWCADTYDIYAYRKLPRKNPLNSQISEYHAIRGGGWQSAANDTRCSKRKHTIPNAQFESVGFRLVMTFSQKIQ